jgi:signal transduction histidine kinase
MKGVLFTAYKLSASIIALLLFTLNLVNSATAITVTARATEESSALTTTHLPYGMDKDDILIPSGNSAQGGIDGNSGRSPTWTFDFTGDPNFASIQHSKSLKSALLKLTLTPEYFQLSPESLGIQGLSDGSSSEHQSLSVQIEVELLDLYESEDILNMLTDNAGKLPVFYQDSTAISSAQLHLTTDTDTLVPSIVRPVILTLVMLTFTLFGYIVWRKRKHRSLQASGTSVNIQETNPPIEEQRMAVIGKMASTIVHDVKNVFTAIRSCAEVIADDELDPHDRKDFAQMIVSEIDRSVDMTQELLEFSRGKARMLNVQRHSAMALVQDTLAVISHDFTSRNITIHTDLQYSGEIQIDVEKMKRVFMNIVTNAREAMLEGGTLTISSHQVANIVQFEFIDTGCGIPPELQTRMFQPLVTEGKPHGTGLGLAIVKDILDKHHAHIEVESVVGQGTTIRILLPVS